MTVPCPLCQQPIVVTFALRRPPLQSVGGPTCVAVIHVDDEPIAAHAAVCPGGPRGGGEPLPAFRAA